MGLECNKTDKTFILVRINPSRQAAGWALFSTFVLFKGKLSSQVIPSIFLWCQAEKPWAPNTNHCQRLAFICWSAGLSCSALPTRWAAFRSPRHWENAAWLVNMICRPWCTTPIWSINSWSPPSLLTSLVPLAQPSLPCQTFRLKLSSVLPAFGQEQMLTARSCKTRLRRRFSKLCTLSVMHYEWACM